MSESEDAGVIAYDFERHQWVGQCPHGDVCAGCDALGYCTRMEPNGTGAVVRPSACPKLGEIEAFDAGWNAHEAGLERETVRVVTPESGRSWALMGYDVRKEAASALTPVAAPTPYEPRPGTPKAILVDLDGTLCLHNGRSPYDETRVSEDLPNEAVVEIVKAARAWGYRVICCSGRTEACREATEAWLGLNLGYALTRGLPKPSAELVWDKLFMRQIGDTRNDAIVNREIFDEHIRDHYDVVFVLDDRQRVVDAWREMGLTVFQVAPGNF